MGGKEGGDRDDRVSADLPFPRAPTFHSVGVCGGERGGGRRGGVNGQIVSIQMRREVADTSRPSAPISPFFPTFGGCAARVQERI